MPASDPADTARRLLVALAVTIALGACDAPPGPAPPSAAGATVTSTSPEPAELAALRARPLRLPTLTPGDECPLTRATAPDPPPPGGHPLSTGGAPLRLGDAPLFPDARYFSGDRSQLPVRAGALHPGWYGTKAPWASRTGYRGWALIRTARLDGPGQARVELQLAHGTRISDALPVNVQADWQFWPGGTEVTAPGCYAYQVDGSGFTEVIVFRAELADQPVRRAFR